MNKITKAIAFSLTAAGVMFGINNKAALAQADYYYIQARHSGQCLNVFNAGTNNGDDVVQGYECKSDNFQWSLIPASPGYYYIRAKHSGQCLNVFNAGTNNGDDVVQGYECKSDNFQWSLIPSGGNLNYIRAKTQWTVLKCF